MKPFRSPNKILWAVDAYQEASRTSRNVTRTIDHFAALFDARVELAYAFAIPKMFMDRKSFAIFQEPYLRAAKTNLARVAKGLKNAVATTAVLSNAFDPKKRGEMKQILSHAAKGGFDMIAVATHGRNAFLKLFLGSFAEGLLNHSPLPLLAIPPHVKHGSKKRPAKLLFPTDFSAPSRRTLDDLIVLAKKRGLELDLVHGLTNPYIPAVLSDATLMGDTFSTKGAPFRDLRKERQGNLDEWVRICRSRGVAASGKIYGSGGLVSDVICRAAKTCKSDLIVLGTDAGKPSHESVGSVTKKVMRKANVPVLVLKY